MLSNKLLFYVVAILLSFGSVHALNDMPPLAELSGEHPHSAFGYSVVSLDFNHDGYDDLVVLSYSYGYVYQLSPARGKVDIFYGGPGFGSNTQSSMSFEGDYPNGLQRKVTGINNTGDVNGDGFDDLMIIDTMPNGSWGNQRYLYYFGGTSDLLAPDRIEFSLDGQDSTQYWKLGDVDGDGYDDIGVFYILNYVLNFAIIWGGSYERQTILSLDNTNTSSFGAIIGIGDINNDAFNDFSIGYYDNLHADNLCNVIVYYGNPYRDYSESTVLISTSANITIVCRPLGDINNDGYDDFLGYIDSSGMNIWLGSNNPLSFEPDVVLNPVYYGDLTVDGVNSGDFNGDGFSDVVGASYNWRRFAVWLGGATMNGFSDYQRYNSTEQFGWDVAVGDFNGDGCDDIAVSASFIDWPASSFLGYVFVYAGNSGMVGNDDPLAPSLTEGINMLISPNPLRKDGFARISLRGADKYKGTPVKVEVFNIKGQAVYQKEVAHTYSQAANVDLNLSGLASGVYLCRASIGNQVLSKKITIIK